MQLLAVLPLIYSSGGGGAGGAAGGEKDGICVFGKREKGERGAGGKENMACKEQSEFATGNQFI